MEVSDTPNFSDIPMLNISSLKETNTTNLQVIHGGGCGSVGNEKKKKPRTGSEDNDHYKTSPPAAAIEELPNSSIYDPPEAEIKPQDWFNDSSPDTSNTDANPSPQKEAKLPDTMESPDPNSETGGKTPHPPKKPSETGEEDPDDYLEILDSRLSARNILLHRPLTRRFILGATRLLLYESEANAEVLASRIFDTMNNSITWLHARQGKMLDALGLNSVALSLMVKGCLFCFGDKAGTAHLRGPVSIPIMLGNSRADNDGDRR
jgi:hypothetical protein